MQPSHQLHLGNYLGALKNWVDLQDQYENIFLAVDLHSITFDHNPAELRNHTYQVIAAYLAAGISPEKSALAVQSHIPQHTELSWVLTCHTYMGELNRMTQFKDKSLQQGKNINAGLFNYPVLMAADILLYQADLVPVGEDQRQHLELTRNLAERMNNRYEKNLFKIPDAFIPPVGARIMDLQEPTKKMSKSAENESGTIFLLDTDKQIEKKLKRAVTDSGSEIRFNDDQPGIQNLLSIQSAITGKTTDQLVSEYSGKQYGHLKVETADIVVEAVRPIRQEMERYLSDTGELDRILKKGAEKCVQLAEKTVREVFDAVGFSPVGRNPSVSEPR